MGSSLCCQKVPKKTQHTNKLRLLHHMYLVYQNVLLDIVHTYVAVITYIHLYGLLFNQVHKCVIINSVC